MFRLLRVGLHLLWGVVTVAIVYRWANYKLRQTLKQRWSHQLVALLGVKLKLGAGSTAPAAAGLLVSNHISWLDVYVINAVVPSTFVAKADVRNWPLIGWLCTHTETIFIERGSRSAAQRTRSAMLAALQSGRHVSVFPEGTTSDGDRLLPFHAALFQSAIDAAVPVMPLALRYVDTTGKPSQTPAYTGDTTLWQSLGAIARAHGLVAQVQILEQQTPDSGATDRRHLSSRCHHLISHHLGHLDHLDHRRHSPVTPAA